MSLRLFWRRFHLWIGVGTGLFLLAIAISGILLMFENKVSSWVNPSFYAVTGAEVSQPIDVYLAKAKEAVANADAAQLRWPEEEGLPVVVLMRLKDAPRQRDSATQPSGEGQAPVERHAERMASNQGAEGEHAGREHRGDGNGRGDGPGRGDGNGWSRGEGERGQGEHRGERGQGAAGGAPMGNAPMANTSTGGAPMSGAPGQGGGRPRVVFVYLDPPTAAVLGTNDPRNSFIGIVHSIHTDLLVPAFSGRQIVGWMGAGLFILCLSGLYLWWPRNAGFLRGMRWRRGPSVPINLHHTVGFWIVIPLGIMAFTGMVQGFQQQSRAVVSMIVPTNVQQNRGGNGPLAKADLMPQQAIDLALSDAAGFHATSLALPTEPNKAWRVQAENSEGDTRTFMVDDATKKVTSPPAPLKGDSTLAFLRRIHEGHHDGPIWETIVLLAGASPPLLFVTGIIMWLRRRRNVKRLAVASRNPQVPMQGIAVN